jgi:hypothetical protein
MTKVAMINKPLPGWYGNTLYVCLITEEPLVEVTAMLLVLSLGRCVNVPPVAVEVSNCGSAAYLFWLSNNVTGLDTLSLPKASTLVPPKETVLPVEASLTRAG